MRGILIACHNSKFCVGENHFNMFFHLVQELKISPCLSLQGIDVWATGMKSGKNLTL
jgi:hypothetical protein